MDHKHYVPIVKAKAGEKWALGHLKSASKPNLTPLFELPPITRRGGADSKTLAQHVTDSLEGIAATWGTGQCYIDTKWLYNPHGDAALTAAFNEARRLSIKAIPVIQPTTTAPTFAEVAAIVKQDKRGVMLRAKRSDLPHPAVAQHAVTAVGLAAKDVDFLLDYRSQPMALPVDLPGVGSISAISSWRSLIAASGVFPSSVSDRQDGTWHRLPRMCWASWQAGLAKAPRKPTFSDYVVRDPGAPASGGNPPVTLRYTTDKEWLVRVDGSLQHGHSTRMHTLCGELIQMPEFAGPAFSAGDQEIEDTATYVNPTPGGAQQWLQWAESHHLEHVVDQLARTI